LTVNLSVQPPVIFIGHYPTWHMMLWSVRSLLFSVGFCFSCEPFWLLYRFYYLVCCTHLRTKSYQVCWEWFVSFLGFLNVDITRYCWKKCQLSPCIHSYIEIICVLVLIRSFCGEMYDIFPHYKSPCKSFCTWYSASK
jgi:hypothetical protein